MYSVEDGTLKLPWIFEQTSSMHFCSSHTIHKLTTTCWYGTLTQHKLLFKCCEYSTKTQEMTTCDILFVGVYFQVELEGGLLSFILASEGHVTELSMWVGLSYCDGDWKPFSLAKRGSLISAAVNDWAEETRGGAVRLRVDSPLFLGGVPTELIHPALDSRSHRHGELY